MRYLRLFVNLTMHHCQKLKIYAFENEMKEFVIILFNTSSKRLMKLQGNDLLESLKIQYAQEGVGQQMGMPL